MTVSAAEKKSRLGRLPLSIIPIVSALVGVSSCQQPKTPQRLECEERGQAKENKQTSQKGCSSPVFTKWSLWDQGTCLRGANMFQQDLSFADNGANFGPLLTQDDIRSLANSGANYVNLSVPGFYYVTNHSTPLWPQMRDHLDRLVDWAEQAGLFVVLSFRTGPGRGEGDITKYGVRERSLFSSVEKKRLFAAMCKEAAIRYGIRKHVVGLDLLVEPHDIDRSEWRSLAQYLIDEVRTVHPSLPIVVGLDNWSNAKAIDGWRPLRGNYVVYAVHQYEPYEYTSKDSTSYEPHDLETLFELLSTWKRQFVHPITVNEFGLKPEKNNAASFLEYQLDLIEALGANHAAWLWEVQDGGGTREFDFKTVAAVKNVFVSNWSKNTLRPKDVCY